MGGGFHQLAFNTFSSRRRIWDCFPGYRHEDCNCHPVHGESFVVASDSEVTHRQRATSFAMFFSRFEGLTASPVADFKTLFEEFGAKFKAARRERIALTPHLDVLGIFGLTSAELRHSRVLAWFLNAFAEHEQGSVFLRALLRLLCDRSAQPRPAFNADCEDYSVERERHKRTDISVYCSGRFAIFVENKVHHSERDFQVSDMISELVKLANAEGIPIQSRFAVFLTDHGGPPETGPLHDVAGFNSGNLIALRREDVFAAFYEALKDESVASPLLENLLSCYANCIRRLRSI